MPTNTRIVLASRPTGWVVPENFRLETVETPPLSDGQVLVLHDMLGLALSGRTPKFVKNFMQGQPNVQAAFAAYVRAVKDISFPAEEHGFSA